MSVLILVTPRKLLRCIFLRMTRLYISLALVNNSMNVGFEARHHQFPFDARIVVESAYGMLENNLMVGSAPMLPILCQ